MPGYLHWWWLNFGQIYWIFIYNKYSLAREPPAYVDCTKRNQGVCSEPMFGTWTERGAQQAGEWGLITLN